MECGSASTSRDRKCGRLQTEGQLPVVGRRFGFNPRLKRSDVKHNLPALKLGDLAERRHAMFCVAVGDLPKERAVALLLDDGELQIGRVLLFHT